MVDRKSQSEYWKNNKDLNTINSYWISPPAIERSKFFSQQLKNYDFNSIFEVGYFSGRNLKYIEKVFPKVKISGLEINPKAVRFAREKLNMDKYLYCMDLHSMDDIAETYDIVFTSGVAIHIPPENIAGVVEKILRLSNKYVMHIEECGNGEVIKGPKYMKPKKRESDQIQWAPDLVGVYKGLGYKPKVISLPEKIRTNGASELIIVEL